MPIFFSSDRSASGSLCPSPGCRPTALGQGRLRSVEWAAAELKPAPPRPGGRPGPLCWHRRHFLGGPVIWEGLWWAWKGKGGWERLFCLFPSSSSDFLPISLSYLDCRMIQTLDLLSSSPKDSFASQSIISVFFLKAVRLPWLILEFQNPNLR